MRTKVILRPDDKSLNGKFPPESDHIYVLLDSTNVGFTVTLPDCRNGNQSEFIFKNIGTHTVRVQAVTGQYLDIYQHHDIRPWDLITLWSDLDKRWIMLDNNSTADNLLITPEGGIAHKYKNGTGATSVKGTIVHITGNNTVDGIIVDIPDPIGVIYESGIANNADMWVVTEGKAECLVIGTCTAGQLARGFVSADAGYVKGSLICEAVPSSPFATDKHFYEFGHVNTGRTGAGLAMIQIHKN